MTDGMLVRITPIWLRPVTFGTVVALHAGVLIGVPWPDAEQPAVSAPIAVQVVPMGQPATAYDAPQEAQLAEVTAVQAKASTAQAAQMKAIEPTNEVKAVEQAEMAEPQETAETKAAEAPALVPEAAIQAIEKEVAALTPIETVVEKK